MTAPRDHALRPPGAWPGAGAGAETARLPAHAGAILLGLAGLFWAEAMASVLLLVPRGASLFDLQFGFGSYVRAMITTGQYADCRQTVCDHASRMPLLIWIATALGHISTDQRVASVLKDLLFAALTIGTLTGVWRGLPPSRARFWTWAAVGGLLVVGLPASKHAGQFNYEEGIAIPLLFLLGLVGPLALDGGVARKLAGRLMLLAIALATALYLLKASYLALFGLTLVVALAWGGWHRAPLVVAGAVLALAAPLGWGLYNHAADGRFAIMTSWDGENLYRGWNGDTARIYPIVEIDRVFDSPAITMPDGQTIAMLPKRVRADFANEWQWNDTDRALAKDWIAANPGAARGLLLKKAGNYLFSLEKTPRQYTATPQPGGAMRRFEDATTALWLVGARVALLGFALGAALLWRRAPGQRAALAFAALLAGAYAAPCVVGFQFERHITAGLILSIGSVLAIGQDAFSQFRARSAQSSKGRE